MFYSPVKGGVKVSHFSVTILKSEPSLNLPHFQSRPAFILLISTSGLIRRETVFHPRNGTSARATLGLRETKWWGDGSLLLIRDHCQVDCFLCHPAERQTEKAFVYSIYIVSFVRTVLNIFLFSFCSICPSMPQ